MDAAEDDAGSFLEQIPVDLLAAQERHPVLPDRPVGLGRRELLLQAIGLDLERALGLQAAIAALGLMHEIADHERGHGVEAERHENGTDATTDHHVRTIAPQG